jgi:hypothetical protein
MPDFGLGSVTAPLWVWILIAIALAALVIGGMRRRA